jgi:hypothetical protein
MDLRQSVNFSVNKILYSSLDDESDDSSKLMVATVSFIQEHIERQRPSHIGLARPRMGNLLHDQEDGHYRLYRDYFHPTKPVFME